MAYQKTFVLEHGLHLHIYDHVLHLRKMHFKYDKDMVKQALKIIEKCAKFNDYENGVEIIVSSFNLIFYF